MGRMKELYMEMNRQLIEDVNWDDTPEYDPTSFTKANTEPQPEAEQADGKKLWIIPSNKDGVDYRIWADSYQQALELLPMIESF
jgi:hypothetical protein